MRRLRGCATLEQSEGRDTVPRALRTGSYFLSPGLFRASRALAPDTGSLCAITGEQEITPASGNRDAESV